MSATQLTGVAEERSSGLRVASLRFRLHHGGASLPPELPEPETLSAALDKALHDTLDPEDRSYWVVRRLGLRFRTGTDFGALNLADAFARTLKAVVRRILAGEIVDGVRRYDSRAHWLADCIWAQACGTAVGQWQFGRYARLAPLPAGDAVRLTLAQEGAEALRALALLAETQRMRSFARRIGDAAARGILRALLPARGAGARVLDAPLRRAISEERAAAPRLRYAPILAAIARYRSSRPDRPPPGIDIAMREAQPGAALVSRAAAGSPLQDSPASRPGLSPGVPDGPRHEHRERGVEVAATASAENLEHDQGWFLETGFAGVFVLWRSVVEMDLLSLLPEGEEGGPARLALAAALTGPDHEAAWSDPSLQWLCNYRPGDEREPPPPPDLARRFVAHYAERRHPRPVEPALSRAGRVNVLEDRSTGDWLALGDRRSCLAAAGRIGEPVGTPAAEARDPAIDLNWFGVAQRCARRPWALLARAAYGDFSRRLYGLQGSSSAWLWDKLLAGWGVLESGSPAVITLPHVQLDLVLRMGALDGTVIDTPGGSLRLQLPGAG